MRTPFQTCTLASFLTGVTATTSSSKSSSLSLIPVIFATTLAAKQSPQTLTAVLKRSRNQSIATTTAYIPVRGTFTACCLTYHDSEDRRRARNGRRSDRGECRDTPWSHHDLTRNNQRYSVQADNIGDLLLGTYQCLILHYLLRSFLVFIFLFLCQVIPNLLFGPCF